MKLFLGFVVAFWLILLAVFVAWVGRGKQITITVPLGDPADDGLFV